MAAVFSAALLALSFTHLGAAHVITPPPLARPTAHPGARAITSRRYGQVGHDELFVRDAGAQTDCDGQNIMFCATGTCYTGGNGYVGCCTAASCAARTICIDHIPATTAIAGCEMDHGGCIYCSDPAAPACVTFSNVLEKQHMMYCDKKALDTSSAWVNLNKITSTSSSSSSSASSDTSSRSTRPSTSTASTTGTPSATATANTNASSSGTDPSTTSTSSSSSTEPSLSTGAVVGIAIGAIAVTAAAALALFCLWLRPRIQRREQREIDAVGGAGPEKSPSGSSDATGLTASPPSYCCSHPPPAPPAAQEQQQHKLTSGPAVVGSGAGLGITTAAAAAAAAAPTPPSSSFSASAATANNSPQPSEMDASLAASPHHRGHQQGGSAGSIRFVPELDSTPVIVGGGGGSTGSRGQGSGGYVPYRPPGYGVAADGATSGGAAAGAWGVGSGPG